MILCFRRFRRAFCLFHQMVWCFRRFRRAFRLFHQMILCFRRFCCAENTKVMCAIPLAADLR